MENKTWTVYKITSPTGKSYVGATSLPPKQRFNGGLGYKFNEPMFADIVKHGWDSFTKETIAVYDDEQTAREREHAEIKKCVGGYNRWRGITPYTPTGRERTAPKQVLCVETGVVYPSIKEAARKTGANKTKISEVCRGIRRKTTHGYHWEFVD